MPRGGGVAHERGAVGRQEGPGRQARQPDLEFRRAGRRRAELHRLRPLARHRDGLRQRHNVRAAGQAQDAGGSRGRGGGHDQQQARGGVQGQAACGAAPARRRGLDVVDERLAQRARISVVHLHSHHGAPAWS